MAEHDGSGQINLDAGNGPPGPLVFGRDGEHSVHTYNPNIVVGSLARVEAIAQGDRKLRVRVEMTYRDPLGAKGLTAFTMTYFPISIPGKPGLFVVRGTFTAGDNVME